MFNVLLGLCIFGSAVICAINHNIEGCCGHFFAIGWFFMYLLERKRANAIFKDYATLIKFLESSKEDIIKEIEKETINEDK